MSIENQRLRISGVSPWLRASCAALGAALLLTGCATRPGEDAPLLSLQGKPLSGYVRMEEVQVAYIGSAGGGHGTLSFHGREHAFTVGGLGVGGIGVSSIDASGEVYNLKSLAAFPGAYAQGRMGFALGDTSKGDLWLQNENGVIMHLKAKRTGLMLSLGGDAVVITMDE
ncbi:hypothetical protein EWI61_00280 [Methylolobus aquaticus]|nr:hypothetical protein EWI61_00280 [Methylolobus aquaticus]